MLRVFKRILLLFLIFVAMGAAAFYVLYLRRTPLPPAPPHARAVSTIASLPGLSACWIETGKTFSRLPIGMTAGSILFRHPSGDLLIDAGNSSHFAQDVSIYPFWLRLKLRSLAGQLNPEVPLPEMLRRAGEDPAKLRWAILSHVHLDHAGGLMDLPHLTVLMTREEILFANDSAAQAKGYVLAAYTKALPNPSAPTLQFEAKPYETFNESADLYHDGSVVVVPLRGHTPGSVGIFVNLSLTRRFFYVGDSVDDERGFQDRVAKTLLLRDSDNDPVLANQIVSKLSQLHETVPGLAIIPAHGRSAYKKFFPAGPLSCISAQ